MTHLKIKYCDSYSKWTKTGPIWSLLNSIFYPIKVLARIKGYIFCSDHYICQSCVTHKSVEKGSLLQQRHVTHLHRCTQTHYVNRGIRTQDLTSCRLFGCLASSIIAGSLACQWWIVNLPELHDWLACYGIQCL